MDIDLPNPAAILGNHDKRHSVKIPSFAAYLYFNKYVAKINSPIQLQPDLKQNCLNVTGEKIPLTGVVRGGTKDH